MIYIQNGMPLAWQDFFFAAYTFNEYLLFAALLYAALSKKPLKYLIVFFSIAFVICQLFLDLTGSKLDSLSIGIETILLFVYIIFFFYDHSSNIKAGYIYNHPIFWVSVGILLYLGVSFFFNILINYMSEAEFNSYWHYTYITEILKNLLFAYAILQASHHHKLNPIKSSHVPYLDIDLN